MPDTSKRYIQLLDLVNSFDKRSDKCLIWPYALTASGYGSLTHHRKRHYAHRLAYQEFVGEIPPHKELLHSCDNPACINVFAHIAPGTHSDNMRDCISKQRKNAPYGERHFKAKITDAIVLQIFTLYNSAPNISQSDLARRFELSQAAVNTILQKKNWRHLNAPPIKRPTVLLGQNIPNSKLLDNDVVTIRQLLSLPDPPTHTELARHYGVHKSLISLIARRKLWKHL